MIEALKGWTASQKHAVAASYLGWTLDALDFFLLVFVLKDVAAEFNTNIGGVALAVTLTLAARPLGAFLFGRLADAYGRRPILMINIAVYSLLSFSTAFAPNLTVFLLVLGQSRSDAVTVAIISTGMPLISALMSWFLDGKRPASFTSQLFVPDALADRLYQRAPYFVRPEDALRNQDDHIYRDGRSDGTMAGVAMTLDPKPVVGGKGYTAQFNIALWTHPHPSNNGRSRNAPPPPPFPGA